jgi:enoyl-CoA hydratase/carnithine racemase
MNNIDSSLPLFLKEGAIATITFNRPQHFNRLHQEDLDHLLALFEQINQDTSIKVVVLTANPNCPHPMFSAGFNIAEFNDEANSNGHGFERVPDALEVLRPITICALNGSVIGGSTDIALACDFRWGIRGMHLRMPAASIGLHFYASGMQRYVDRWSLAMAKKAFLTAQSFNDEQLLESGFLDQLFTPDELLPKVYELAEHISLLAPLAVQGMKKSLHVISKTAYHLTAISELEQQVNQSNDFKEGRLALKQRRSPLFTGN